jgi:Type I phosphodiesterase / nucleotide pyrophosphatase
MIAYLCLKSRLNRCAEEEQSTASGDSRILSIDTPSKGRIVICPSPCDIEALAGAGPRTNAAERPARCALWLRIDGLDAALAAQARLPNLMELRRHGAWTWHAVEESSLSAEGVWRGHPLGALFTAARSMGLHTAFVGGCRGRRRNMLVEAVDYFSFPGSCPWSVAQEAASLLWNADPDLSGVQFAAPETAACRHGWGSREHLAAIETCDAALGILTHAIRQTRHADETLLIVTAQHGAPEDAGAAPPGVPWVCLGPRIPANHEIDAPITPADSAALLARALGLSLPPLAPAAPAYLRSQLARQHC